MGMGENEPKLLGKPNNGYARPRLLLKGNNMIQVIPVNHPPLHQCPMCGGEMEYLGTLGCLAHYRCRDCGMMTNEDEGACG